MGWKPLHVSASAGAHLPSLLISANFSIDSYALHLTDLTNIWSESLDRRAIIRRVNEENTSIDPSQGADQFQIFLGKLASGLAGEESTTLVLTIGKNTDRPSLVLNVNVDLPGGLAPLQWPIRLSAAPQTVLTSQLIAPLIRAQHVKVQEIASLAEVLRDKDHVIQKLLDKLEEQGTDLGQVFPQAAGKIGRKVDRKTAQGRVKGLGPFDLETWRGSTSHEVTQNMDKLVTDVFAGVEIGGPSTEEGSDSEDWWDNIKGITVDLTTGRISTKGPSKTLPKSLPKPTPRKQESDDDDDFQVQATPPHLKSAPLAALQETTDDDDDLEAPSQTSKIPDSYPISQPKSTSPKALKKPGGIHGKRVVAKPDPAVVDDSQDSEPKIVSRSRRKKTTAKLPVRMDEDSTDSEPNTTVTSRKQASPRAPSKALSPVDDDEATASETASSRRSTPAREKAPSLTPEPSPAEAKRRLGKIGGKKEPPPPSPELEPETEDEDFSPHPRKTTPAEEAAKPKKGKLGKIGGKRKQVDGLAVEETESDPKPKPAQPVTPAKRKLGTIQGHRTNGASDKVTPTKVDKEKEVKPEKEATPSPHETAEEKANKKREQLKKELEAKAQAPPKKKRKF